MSELKVTGTITSISEVQTGVSERTGEEWAKIGFAIKTGGQYPQDIYFTQFGVDKVERFQKFNKVGDEVEVSFEPRSREYEGKWYTDLNAWKVWTVNKGQAVEEPVLEPEGEEDDLPF